MTLTRTLTRLIDLLYVKPLRRIVPPQTFRYAACGGLNMALDLSLYFLLYNFVLDKRVVHIDGIVAISPYIAAFLIVFPITFLTATSRSTARLCAVGCNCFAICSACAARSCSIMPA